MHRLFASGLCFAWLLLAGVVGDVGRAQAQAPKLTDITFSLDFIVLGRHAPFFVAIEKGFFREEGLNVNIISAKGTAHGIQNVESGLAQIGFIDVASLVVARAEGSTVKVASVIYQKAPFCFFSLSPGANVTKLKDFEGLRVGSNTGSYISNIARAMMRKEGLDPSKLSVESIEPSARIAMLATRKIPAIDFFIITKPAMERAVKDAKALNNEITVDELKIVEELTVTPEVKQSGIGSFTTARMQSSVAWMVENGGFPKEKAPKVGDVYAAGFLPAKPVMP